LLERDVCTVVWQWGGAAAGAGACANALMLPSVIAALNAMTVIDKRRI
jgi:hypothetical protein